VHPKTKKNDFHDVFVLTFQRNEVVCTLQQSDEKGLFLRKREDQENISVCQSLERRWTA